MATHSMSYVEVPAPPEIRPWVAALWCFRVFPEAGTLEHRIPLTGGIIVSVGPDPEPMLSGPRAAPLVVPVHGGEVFRGFHVWPGAGCSLLHLPHRSLRDCQGPARLWLDPDWCRRLSTVAEVEDDAEALQGIALCLRELIARAAPLDTVVMTAVSRLIRSRGDLRIGDLAEGCLSPRQLRRRFQAAVGLSPKELARIRRLRASAAAAVLEELSWCEVTADAGYADQAHLVREFRDLLGVTPGAFEQHARRIDHRLVD
jgi:AraC-like DNA-binding protein